MATEEPKFELISKH
jgi:hypothetical protein